MTLYGQGNIRAALEEAAERIETAGSTGDAIAGAEFRALVIFALRELLREKE